MPNVSNKFVVDKAVDMLANLYKGILRKHHSNGEVDFSGLSELIMSAVEQGSLEQIDPIINKFVDTKIRNYDRIAGALAERARAGNMDSLSKRHKKIVEDMIGFGKKWNSQCAQAIAQNVKVAKTQEQGFREGLANFRSDGAEPAKQVSIDEALQRNAQSLYERTGKVPEGYTLNQDGQVMKEKNNEDTSKVEPKESTIEDMQLQ